MVALACTIFAALAFSFLRSAAPTYDENVYLPAGYTYLQWADYRIDPEHPPLAKKLAALPLMAQQIWPAEVEPAEEDYSDSRFFSSDHFLRLSWAIAAKYPLLQFNFAHQFLYGIREHTQHRFGAATPLLVPTTVSLQATDFHNNVDRMMLAGRLMMLLLGIALAIFVYLWSRQLHGAASAAVLSIALFIFDPNFIAHSGLVATDVPLAFFITGTIFFYWRLCRRLEMGNLLLFLLCFSLAFVTKFSAAVLVPIYGLIAVGRVFNRDDWPTSQDFARRLTQSGSGRASILLIVFLAAGLATWGTIWAFYSFRYSAARDPEKLAIQEKRVSSVIPEFGSADYREPGHLPLEQDARRARAIQSLIRKGSIRDIPEAAIQEAMKTVPLGLSGQLLLMANRYKLLPEAYLAGFARVGVVSLLHPSYLRGEYSSIGFKSYFLWTLLLKSTLPALFAVAAGFYLAITRRISWKSDLAFLVIPAGVYFAFAVTTGLNIGHRHLLPVLPFLYVLAGIVASPVPARSSQSLWPNRALIGGLLAIAVSSSFVFYPPWRPQIVFPHYLSYFNELAGGPRHGWRQLADSNIDWGQDLKGLKEWLDRERLERPIYLCYFGMADPRYYQIIHYPVPRTLGGYAPTANESDASAAVEKFVTSLRPGDHIAISVQNLIGPALSESKRQVWNQIIRRSTLVDRIGYSIFIYKVNGQP